MRISSLLSRVGAPSAALLLVLALACGKSSDAKTPSATAASAPGATATPARATAASATPASASGETVAQAGSMPADSAAQRAAADSGRIMGAPGAKLWIIIASDFQCPYCKMWHDQTYHALKESYVDAGRARMAYVNYPLDMHQQAKPAAEAAMCASAQRKFWEYHSALFVAQDSWAKAGDQSAVYDSLAGVVGADVARFRACTRSHVMRAVVEADHDRMQSGGVASTPTFFIGNQRVEGAQPLPVFKQAVDQALAAAGR